MAYRNWNVPYATRRHYVNIKNKFGKTPLDIAYDNKNMRLAHALEKAGAKRGKDLGIKAKVRRSIKKCRGIFAGA